MAPRKAPKVPHGDFQPIDFGHASAEGKSGYESSIRLLNGYVEQLGVAKTPDPVYVTPGTTRFDKTSPLTGPCRGMIYVSGKGLFVLCGTTMAVFNSSGQGTAIAGTVAGSGMVHMAANKALNPQIGIVAGQDYYVLDTGLNTVTLQNNANLPPPSSICALDGYLVFGIPDGRIFHSAINDARTVNALAFGTIGSSPNGLRRLITYRNTVIALTEGATEVWEDVGTTPFAFSQNRTSYNIGCVAPLSAIVINESLLWVDHNGQVRQSIGFKPSVVSIPAVDSAINQLTAFQKSLIYATYTSIKGHNFYALTSIYWTWELDLSTMLWHERQSQNVSNWFARGWENFNGARIVGSSTDASLNLVDQNSATEGGTATPFPFLTQSEPITAFPRGLLFDEIRVDAIPGTGRTTTMTDNYSVDAQNPQLALTWSDDGANTWAPPRAAPIGKVGQRTTPISYYQMGGCRREGRVLQLSCMSNVVRGIFLVSARMREYEV
jgi:hypothetical protein